MARQKLLKRDARRRASTRWKAGHLSDGRLALLVQEPIGLLSRPLASHLEGVAVAVLHRQGKQRRDPTRSKHRLQIAPEAEGEGRLAPRVPGVRGSGGSTDGLARLVAAKPRNAYLAISTEVAPIDTRKPCMTTNMVSANATESAKVAAAMDRVVPMEYSRADPPNFVVSNVYQPQPSQPHPTNKRKYR